MRKAADSPALGRVLYSGPRRSVLRHHRRASSSDGSSAPLIRVRSAVRVCPGPLTFTAAGVSVPHRLKRIMAVSSSLECGLRAHALVRSLAARSMHRMCSARRTRTSAQERITTEGSVVRTTRQKRCRSCYCQAPVGGPRRCVLPDTPRRLTSRTVTDRTIGRSSPTLRKR